MARKTCSPSSFFGVFVGDTEIAPTLHFKKSMGNVNLFSEKHLQMEYHHRTFDEFRQLYILVGYDYKYAAPTALNMSHGLTDISKPKR